jgi:putative membrane protein
MTRFFTICAISASVLLAACGEDEGRGASPAESSERSAAPGASADTSGRDVVAATPGAGGGIGPTGATTPGGTVTGQPGADARPAIPDSGSTAAPPTGGGSSGATMSGAVPSNPSPGMATQGRQGASVTGGAAPGREATATVGTTERKFVDAAATGGLLEVEAGRVVQQRGSSPAVRDLAERLVRDHETANQELKQIAQSKSLQVPERLKPEQQAEVDRLRKADAKELDRMYLRRIGLDHHRKDIAEFERTARESNDAEIRAFAEKNLPILREHHAEAQKVASAMQGR